MKYTKSIWNICLWFKNNNKNILIFITHLKKIEHNVSLKHLFAALNSVCAPTYCSS